MYSIDHASFTHPRPNLFKNIRRRLRRGITVIETSIAIAIGLVVLAGLVILGYGLLRDAEISSTVDDFARIPQALKSLGANQSFYSATDNADLTAVVARLSSIPTSVITYSGTPERPTGLQLGDDEIPIKIFSGGAGAGAALGAPNRRSFTILIGTIGAGNFLDDVDLCVALLSRPYLGLRGLGTTPTVAAASSTAMTRTEWVRPGLVAASSDLADFTALDASTECEATAGVAGTGGIVGLAFD